VKKRLSGRQFPMAYIIYSFRFIKKTLIRAITESKIRGVPVKRILQVGILSFINSCFSSIAFSIASRRLPIVS
jgi:Na+-driven multidrug efflux pump